MKAGDSCYFLESNRTIIKGQVKSVSGNLYTILLPSGGAIRLPKHRIYGTVEEAEKNIKKKIRIRTDQWQTRMIIGIRH